MTRALGIYKSELKRSKPLPREKEQALSALAKSGDEKALAKLITANLKMVVAIAKMFVGSGLSFEDLVCEGNLGLVRAAKRFDGSKGFKFGSYAVWWVRQAMAQAIYENNEQIRTPKSCYDDLRKIYKQKKALWQKLGRKPNIPEISEATGLKEDRIFYLKSNFLGVISLESPVAGRPGFSVSGTLKDEKVQEPEDRVFRAELRQELLKHISNLTATQKKVIMLHYGMDGNTELTLGDIGDNLGISKEAVRQAKIKALERMKKPWRITKLKKFVENI